MENIKLREDYNELIDLIGNGFFYIMYFISFFANYFMCIYFKILLIINVMK